MPVASGSGVITKIKCCQTRSGSQTAMRISAYRIDGVIYEIPAPAVVMSVDTENSQMKVSAGVGKRGHG